MKVAQRKPREVQSCKCEDKSEILKPLSWEGEEFPKYLVSNHGGRVWWKSGEKLVPLKPNIGKKTVAVRCPKQKSLPQILLNTFHPEMCELKERYIAYADGNDRNLCAANIITTGIPQRGAKRKNNDTYYCETCSQWLPPTAFTPPRKQLCSECLRAKSRNQKKQASGDRPRLCVRCKTISVPARGCLIGKGKDPSYLCQLCNRIKINRIKYENRCLLDQLLNDKKCLNCGVTERRLLEFAHIDPSTKIAPVTYQGSKRSILAEAAKTKILCRFCHRIETAKERNFYAKNKGAIKRNTEYVNKIKIEERRTCVDCNRVCNATNVFAFDFDHVRDKKVTYLSALRQRAKSVQEIDAEIAKCDLRCVNCHKFITYQRLLAQRRRDWLLWKEWKEMEVGIETDARAEMDTCTDTKENRDPSLLKIIALGAKEHLSLEETQRILFAKEERMKQESHCRRYCPELVKNVYETPRLNACPELANSPFCR